jgi:site-specific recombinase XerC
MSGTPSEKAVAAHLKHLALQGRTKMTRYHRQRALIRLAAALPVPILDATPDQLYEWRAGLTVGNGTAAQYLASVKGFYAWAVTAGLLEEDPSAALPVPRTHRKIPRPIPEADLMLAMSHTTPRMRVRQWFVLAGWCGLRCCEIAGLRMENLRLRDTPPVVIVSAESAKGGRERVVELSPWVVAELTAADLPSHGLAFPAASGKQLSPYMVSKIGGEHLHGCGSDATMHNLRDRFASQMYQQTKDIRLVQEMLGHATPVHTAGYAAFSRRGAGAAVAALPVPGEEAAA